jgi:hypothetical protein
MVQVHQPLKFFPKSTIYKWPVIQEVTNLHREHADYNSNSKYLTPNPQIGMF